MPKKVDPHSRRQALAEALWRVARRDGWDAVSLRQVAAEAGVSMGLVQHYFTNKDEMLQFALGRITGDLELRIARRVAELTLPFEPRQIVEVVLVEMMPREDGDRTEAEAAIAFGGRVARHPELGASMVTRGAELRAKLAEYIRAGRVDERIDAELASAGLLALVEGLIAQTLLGRHTPASARSVLLAQLDLIFGPCEL